MPAPVPSAAREPVAAAWRHLPDNRRRGRRRAIRGNWCAGAALDDDQLDIPGYRPASGWKAATGIGTAGDIHPTRRSRRNKRT